MTGKAIQILSTLFLLSLIVGCAIPGPHVPIINPQHIDQEEAREQFLSKYCNLIIKTDRKGFETATAMCRRIQAGEIKLDGRKSSENGRYVAWTFKENDVAGLSKGDYSMIAFYFDPWSELMRMCNQDGLCDVYVRNGMTRFGRINAITHGGPMVDDKGITAQFDEGRSSAYDMLFSYKKGNDREGDELISIFLSVFPFLYYQ